MLQPRRYAILGTGAIGGFYGARLQQAGLDVHFLLRSDYDQVRCQGLRVDSPEGDLVLPQVQVYSDVSQMPQCDVVVLALKTTQNHLLSQLLPPILKPDGVVLVLQNGLGMEAEVAQVVGCNRVIGGLCFICSHKVGPGHIRHLDYSAITLGEYSAQQQPVGATERMGQINQDFQRAGIPIHLADDLLQARWQKLVWNIPFNGLSVVLNARTDELMVSSICSLVEQLMKEVIQGAAACDRIIPPDFIDTMLAHTAQMKPYYTSMKLDYDRRQPLELVAIFSNPLWAATQAGVTLPRISMLYEQLNFLDTVNRPTPTNPNLA